MIYFKTNFNLIALRRLFSNEKFLGEKSEEQSVLISCFDLYILHSKIKIKSKNTKRNEETKITNKKSKNTKRNEETKITKKIKKHKNKKKN